MAMHRSAILVFSFLLVGWCAAPTWSAPAKAEPGTMWVILNHVKADRRANFEAFLYERLLPALQKASASDQTSAKLHKQTRVLVPKEANSDGTYTYIWVMDPVVPGADYDYRAILERAYSKADTDGALALVDGAMASPQVVYVVASSTRW